MEKVLTVVIPTYNMEKYLVNCLDSLIYSEETNDLEVLVVNDGSKDGSLKIARQYEEKLPNIFKVIDKENGGHGSTINAGLKVATGKYFKVIDSDDWVDTVAFEKLVECLKSQNVDCVCCNYNHVYEKSNKTKFIDCRMGEENAIVDIKNIKDFKFYMAGTTYKTEIIRDVVLDEKCFYVDVEFNEFCACRCKTVLNLPLNIYRYRIGRVGQSVSLQGFYKHRNDHLKVIKRLLSVLNDCELDLIKQDCCDVITHHYANYIGIYSLDRETVNELKAFDEELKQNEYFYNYTNSNKKIKSLRKSNFKSIKRLNFLYKCKSFIKKILGRG